MVGSQLRCAYNHVLLEKTSRFYQIRCLCVSQLQLRPAPTPLRADPRALAFFGVGWQISGGRDY